MQIKGYNVKLGKILVVVFIIVAIVVVAWQRNTILSAIKGDNSRTIVLNNWSGFAPEIMMNNGMNYDPTSRNAMEFDLKVKFQQIDKRSAAVAAFATKQADAIWCTIDMLSCETGTSPMSDLMRSGAVVILVNDRSNGADVITVDRSIKTIQDFKGQKVAFVPASASHSVLLKLLASGGMTMSDIIPVYCETGMDAAAFMKNREVKIAVVWSPDDQDIYKDVQGSYEFFSTAKAKNLVYDGLMVRKEDLQNKDFREWATKLVKSWLTANAECTVSDSKKQQAAEVFARSFTNAATDIVVDGLNKVRLTTLEDNRNLFGLNPIYNGVTAEDAYTSMARIYTTIRDEKGSYFSANPASWTSVSDGTIISSITGLSGAQAAEPDVIKFTPVTPAQEKVLAAATPITSVKVTVNFPINSAVLDEDAKSIIDRAVAPYAKEFSGYRMRTEGHTDASTGTVQGNIDLSYRRAFAVQTYLQKAYGFDPNRFITPMGWGSSRPLYPNETTEQERAANRRTEFSFINE